MNLYAMSTTRPTGMPTGSIPSIVSSDRANAYTMINIVAFLIIFIVGMFWVLKRLGKENHSNATLRGISYVLPIIGIILFFWNLKKDKQMAFDYLKSGLIGMIAYALMVLIVFILSEINANAIFA
ncbi:MAG: hypothetical protein Q4D02_05595 [Clostridia bacterium]|nr:hypothetical protein [Clostridia bacterium]